MRVTKDKKNNISIIISIIVVIVSILIISIIGLVNTIKKQKRAEILQAKKNAIIEKQKEKIENVNNIQEEINDSPDLSKINITLNSINSNIADIGIVESGKTFNERNIKGLNDAISFLKYAKKNIKNINKYKFSISETGLDNNGGDIENPIQIATFYIDISNIKNIKSLTKNDIMLKKQFNYVCKDNKAFDKMNLIESIKNSLSDISSSDEINNLNVSVTREGSKYICNITITTTGENSSEALQYGISNAVKSIKIINSNYSNISKYKFNISDATGVNIASFEINPNEMDINNLTERDIIHSNSDNYIFNPDKILDAQKRNDDGISTAGNFAEIPWGQIPQSNWTNCTSDPSKYMTKETAYLLGYDGSGFSFYKNSKGKFYLEWTIAPNAPVNTDFIPSNELKVFCKNVMAKLPIGLDVVFMNKGTSQESYIFTNKGINQYGVHIYAMQSAYQFVNPNSVGFSDKLNAASWWEKNIY